MVVISDNRFIVVLLNIDMITRITLNLNCDGCTVIKWWKTIQMSTVGARRCTVISPMSVFLRRVYFSDECISFEIMLMSARFEDLEGLV